MTRVPLRRQGMRYGGTVSACAWGKLCHNHVAHGISVNTVIEMLLGTSGYFVVPLNVSYYGQGPARFISEPLPQDPHRTRPRLTVRQLGGVQEALSANGSQLAQHRPAPAILYSSSYFPLEGWGGVGLDEYFTPKLLSRLRGAAACRLGERVSHFASGRISVAMHVRRGDVANVGFVRIRFTPDQFYLRVAAVIRKVLPTAQIHVYSQMERHYSRSSFRVFERNGMFVHLDGDPLSALAHLARADVLVMAKRAFSSAAALFNPNCVLYDPFWFGKLARWGYSNDVRLERSLRDCIAGQLHQPDDPARVAKAYSQMLGR